MSSYLIGVHQCKLDSKNRFMIPKAFKKQLRSSVDSPFVLKRSVFHKCLELYTMNEWNKVVFRINKLNRFVKKNNDFIRRFTAGVKFVELDGNGRLLIPKDLIEFSNISKEVTLSTSVNIIEIWDRSSYEKAIADSRDDFAKLAEEVMGGDEE